MSFIKVVVFSLFTMVIGSVVSSLIGVHRPIFTLNENQILYLYSTTAQVMSAIYGLTLTGFIFFRNELSREESEDESLIQAIESLKERYYKLLLYVTGFSIFSILSCSLIISAETIVSIPLRSVLMNVSQVSFVVSLAIITYFITDIVAPKRIEKASKVLQERYDPGYSYEKKGSLEDFLKNFNSIENKIREYGDKNQASDYFNSFGQRKRISTLKIAEFLLKSERINYELFTDIRNLISLRNSIVHGAEPVVSIDMVNKSSTILNELTDILEGFI